MEAIGVLKNSFQRLEPWLYVGPALLVTIVLAISPVAYLAQAMFKDMEFGDSIGGAQGAGFENFELAFGESARILDGLRLTAVYTLAALTLELFLGLVIALVIENMKRLLPFVMSIFLVPMVVMPAMVAMVWRLYFSYEGLVNWVVGLIGVSPLNWYGPEHAMKAVIITDVWQWTPFFVLLFTAGLQNVPREIEEAAEVDGASTWQVLRRIKMPLLAPLIVIAATLRVMELVRQFDLPYIMFGGGPGSATRTLPLAVFNTTVQKLDVGVGSVLSLVLIALVVAVSWVFLMAMKRAKVAH
jgi:multiple sugar transport system permease protein